MRVSRSSLAAILVVAASLFVARPLVAGPYNPPGITPAYTLIPQSGCCEQRIQRVERMLETIAKKVGVEIDPVIIPIAVQNTRLITRADGVTVLDESCIWPESSILLDMIKQSEPKDDTAAQLKELEIRRAEVLGQMLKAFDELRSTDAKIEQIKQRMSAPK
jgi:hypothetical protein